MHSDPEDRLYLQEKKRLPTLHLVLIVIGIVGIVAAIYLPNRDSEPTIEEGATAIASTPVPVEPPPAIVLPEAPDIPAPEPETAPAPELAPAIAPVSLETSDLELRELLTPIEASPLINQALETDDLILRSAGFIDGFSHGLTPRKILPLKPPKQKFTSLIIDGEAQVDPASYQRYDNYTKAITAVDTGLLVTAFHRYRPLIEQAYEEFGYSAEELDNALIRSLDYVLATPELDRPIALERKEAVFLYADPELEQLPSLQKQLLRMGPDNTAKIKQWAEALRQGLLGVSTDN